MQLLNFQGTEDGLGEEAPAVTFEMGILGKFFRFVLMIFSAQQMVVRWMNN